MNASTIMRKTRPGRQLRQGVPRYKCGQIKHSHRDETVEQAVSTVMTARERQGLPHPAGEPLKGAVVYVMESRGYTKVGFSRNAARRQYELQSNNPAEVAIVWSGRATAEEAHRLEQAVHAKLRQEGKRVRGEWYDMASHEAVQAVMAEADRCGIQLAFGD